MDWCEGLRQVPLHAAISCERSTLFRTFRGDFVDFAQSDKS